jgi:hypothetical protein
VLRMTTRAASTELPAEHADLVVQLDALSRAIIERDRRVMAGERVDWSRVADRLAALTRECRRRDVPELHDIGDSGGR